VLLNRHQPLADIRAQARIDKSDLPVMDVSAVKLYRAATPGHGEIVRDRLVVTKEEPLDRFTLMTEAEDESLWP
jgi:hypothetical protein